MKTLNLFLVAAIKKGHDMDEKTKELLEDLELEMFCVG